MIMHHLVFLLVICFIIRSISIPQLGDLKKQIEAGTLKTIEDLKKLKTVSKKDVSKSLESDYETIVDNPDVLIVSRKIDFVAINSIYSSDF